MDKGLGCLVLGILVTAVLVLAGMWLYAEANTAAENYAWADVSRINAISDAERRELSARAEADRVRIAAKAQADAERERAEADAYARRQQAEAERVRSEALAALTRAEQEATLMRAQAAQVLAQGQARLDNSQAISAMVISLIPWGILGAAVVLGLSVVLTAVAVFGNRQNAAIAPRPQFVLMSPGDRNYRALLGMAEAGDPDVIVLNKNQWRSK